MGTRSDIIVHCADGKWRRVYCHSDGYLSHNGRILFDHYTSQKHADALVALGSLSLLGPAIGRKHPWMTPYREGDAAVAEYKRKYGDMCIAYGRDRGDRDTEASVGDTLFEVWPPDETWTEFTYVWDQDKWWAADPDEGTQTLVDLGDLLTGKRTLKPSVKVPFLGAVGRHPAHDPTKDNN